MYSLKKTACLSKDNYPQYLHIEPHTSPLRPTLDNVQEWGILIADIKTVYVPLNYSMHLH